MTYLSMFRDDSQAESSDGTTISCDYFEHPRFSFGCNFCAALHYVFIRFVPDRNNSRGFGLRKAINLLLDFTVEFEQRNHIRFHLNDVSLLNAEIYLQFDLHIKKQGKRLDTPSRLKEALKAVALNFDDGLPLLSLTKLATTEHKSHEPLSFQAFEDLENAFKTHIDKLYKKLEFRRLVDQSTPYTISDIYDEWHDVFNKRNTLLFYAHLISQKKTGRNKRADYQRLMGICSLCRDDERLVKMSKISSLEDFWTEFTEYYELNCSEISALAVIDPFRKLSLTSQSIFRWKPNPIRILNTLLNAGHPFSLPYEDVRAVYESSKTLRDDLSELELIYRRYITDAGGKYQNKHLDNQSFEDLLASYFPTSVDQAAIILFIMLQTGWNKETVTALNGDNYLHLLTGAVETSRVLLVSEKNKSQGIGKPYEDPKLFQAISEKADKYSAYNLIRLANALSAPLASLPFEATAKQITDGHNPLFCCFRPGGFVSEHSPLPILQP